MVIGVSKLSENYGNWLKKINEEIEIVDLYHMTAGEVKNWLPLISGFLLTGGSDIHPALYKQAQNLPYCKNIDENRDAMELLVIDFAYRQKTPLLGVCRGQQIMNVAMKGTLYPDIPSFTQTTIIHSGAEDVYHDIHVVAGSLLNRITGVESGDVNSAHHQALNIIGTSLLVTAYSRDSIAEAIEADVIMKHPFFLGVQWHPERMEIQDPLSGNLGKGFLEAAQEKENY